MLLLFAHITAIGQTQQVRVKTVGHPNKPGVALGNVVVNLRGNTNALISNNEGVFSFAVKGDNYSLSRVRLADYELADKGVIGRVYGYTPNTPMEFSMISTAELAENRRSITENLRTAQDAARARDIANLKLQLERKSITADEMQKKLDEMEARLQREDSLIDYLADVYARVDYDRIDSTTALINKYLLEGKLEMAEMILHSKGDLDKRMSNIMKRRAVMQMMDERDKQETQELAADLYTQYNIAKAQGKKDVAIACLEKRAALDTLNVQWQKDAYDVMNNEDLFIRRYNDMLVISDSFWEKRRMYLDRIINLSNNEPITLLFAYKRMSDLYANDDLAEILAVEKDSSKIDYNFPFDIDKSIDYLNKALQLADTKSMQSYLYSILSRKYSYKDVKKCIYYAEKSIKVGSSDKHSVYVLLQLSESSLLAEHELQYLKRAESLLAKIPGITRSHQHVYKKFYEYYKLHNILDKQLEYGEKYIECLRHLLSADEEYSYDLESISYALSEMAALYMQKKNFTKVAECYSECLSYKIKKLQRQDSPYDRIAIAETMLEYSNALTMNGQFEESERVLVESLKHAEEAYDIYKWRYRTYMLDFYKRLAELYKQQGDEEKAKSVLYILRHEN